MQDTTIKDPQGFAESKVTRIGGHEGNFPTFFVQPEEALLMTTYSNTPDPKKEDDKSPELDAWLLWSSWKSPLSCLAEAWWPTCSLEAAESTETDDLAIAGPGKCLVSSAIEALSLSVETRFLLTE